MKFLNTSESSLAEVGYCVHVAGRLGYITAQKVAELETEIRAVGAPLTGLIRTTKAESAAQLGAAFIGGMVAMWVAL